MPDEIRIGLDAEPRPARQADTAAAVLDLLADPERFYKQFLPGSERFMLFSGKPMEGPRYIWRNLVSSRLKRIDTVPGDEAGFIPLPEDKGRPRKAAGGRSFD